jgi:UDP-N-acetylglucosamine 1-carboxyvinyltransferase
VSIAIVVATQARGTIIIFEKMFEGRMFFVDKPGRARIGCATLPRGVTGPAHLHGEELVSPDIRSRRALLIAALARKQTSSERWPDRPIRASRSG